MATSLTVRGLDEALVQKLKLRAPWHRLTLRQALGYTPGYCATAVPARH
jgi:hypothetical protein